MEPIDKNYVAALEKGLSIIEAFGLANRALTLTEAAGITGHTRASARRSLLTLEKLGYVEFDGKRFHLAPRTLRLGHAYLTSTQLAKTVQPALEALSERTRESTSFAVLDGVEVAFVARAATRRSLSTGLGLGSRLPAHAAATGRVLLAALSDEEITLRLKRMARNALTAHTQTQVAVLMRTIRAARRQGFSTSDEEIEVGVRSLAVPLKNNRGKTMGAISIVSAANRMSRDEMIEVFVPELQQAALRLSNLLSN